MGIMKIRRSCFFGPNVISGKFIWKIRTTNAIYSGTGKRLPCESHEGVGEVEVKRYSFLTSILDRGGWSARRTYHFTHVEKLPVTNE